jgi:hypothetical protein
VLSLAYENHPRLYCRGRPLPPHRSLCPRCRRRSLPPHHPSRHLRPYSLEITPPGVYRAGLTVENAAKRPLRRGFRGGSSSPAADSTVKGHFDRGFHTCVRDGVSAPDAVISLQNLYRDNVAELGGTVGAVLKGEGDVAATVWTNHVVDELVDGADARASLVTDANNGLDRVIEAVCIGQDGDDFGAADDLAHGSTSKKNRSMVWGGCQHFHLEQAREPVGAVGAKAADGEGEHEREDERGHVVLDVILAPLLFNPCVGVFDGGDVADRLAVALVFHTPMVHPTRRSVNPFREDVGNLTPWIRRRNAPCAADSAVVAVRPPRIPLSRGNLTVDSTPASGTRFITSSLNVLGSIKGAMVIRAEVHPCRLRA